MYNIKWAYAMNQWGGMNYLRNENILRAFKTASVCGAKAIELKTGSGRMNPLGRPMLINRSFNSAERFLLNLHECSIDKVVSWFYDPTIPAAEEGVMCRNTADAAEAEGVVEALRPFAEYLQQLHGEYINVRPVGSYWELGELTDEQINNVGKCWSMVGAMLRDYGLKVAMHIDWASAIHTKEQVEKLLAATDPQTTGLCLDTAELTLAGFDAVEFYNQFADRVILFHFKDTNAVAPENLYKSRTANLELRSQYGRWFYPMAYGVGKVDFEALVRSMKEHEYNGWVILESDQSENPAESAMLNNWYIRNVLSKI